MELTNLLNIFESEKECDYKEEHYSVRDNGSILRHAKGGKKSRRLDNIWTFGKLNSSTGYLEYGGERVHRIVATAFHGTPPNSEYVVDHIDTNRQNNRPQNLRWVTRLENILLNEITRTKLEQLTGLSIRAIFNNISILRTFNLPPNLSWMGVVSEDEAKESLSSWEAWVQKKHTLQEPLCDPIEVSWVGFFPLCPTYIRQSALIDYFNQLNKGTIIYNSKLFLTRVIECEMTNDKNIIFVKGHSKDSVKPWILYKITYIDYTFCHTYQIYFAKESLEKYYTEALGREWNGGEVFDDFC